ncbi:MAG: YigZ family protein [Pontibacterium sp.]
MQYPVPAGPAEFELVIKRSQFITYSGRASNREEAEAFIRDLRERYPDARHVCWAYIAGAPNTTVMSMSDDGEPSGTAGRPMLNVLQHSGIGEIVVAVVRYFGGIKLGTGGLQRAYADAVLGVLEAQPLVTKIPRTAFVIDYDYSLDNSVRHILSGFDVEQPDYQYDARVSMSGWVDTAQAQTLVEQITNVTAGAARVTLPESTDS